MKLSAQEEYGLRCILQLARRAPGSATTPEIARAEGLGESYVAKLLRLLRQAELVHSARGRDGGYSLSLAPEDVTVGRVVAALGGSFYSDSFCERFSGDETSCVHRCDCSLRSLWRGIDFVVKGLLDSCTLADLMGSEGDMSHWVRERLAHLGQEASKPTV